MAKSKKEKILCPETDVVDQLTTMQTYILLEDLMNKLDELDLDDFFGTEGWRKFVGYGD